MGGKQNCPVVGLMRSGLIEYSAFESSTIPLDYLTKERRKAILEYDRRYCLDFFADVIAWIF
jgi:hypothetical protein